jgi:hypothetical protein
MTMRRYLKVLCFGLGLTLLGIASPLGAAAMESSDCLGCHGDSEMVEAKFQVDQFAYDHTAHGELGCLTCHESVTADHPDDGLTPSKAGCQDCHQEVGEEYARTEHAAYAACGDCHNPHTVHATREVSGYDMNRKCAACHDSSEMVTAHGSWLPQAGLHLDRLPCISCHTGSENYVVTLFLVRREGGLEPNASPSTAPFALAHHEELKTLAGDGGVESLVDADGDGVVTLTELKVFNGSRQFRALRLRGMLSPEVVSHSLQTLDNRWDCTFCHASGSAALQTSFLALPREDGSYGRLPVETGAILDALNGTPDFYMMGATRNSTLDMIGLAILAGGLIMPVGHGTLRFLTRKNRR